MEGRERPGDGAGRFRGERDERRGDGRGLRDQRMIGAVGILLLLVMAGRHGRGRSRAGGHALELGADDQQDGAEDQLRAQHAFTESITSWHTKTVRCTCGATLPDDALFCHRCGKPQREILNVEPEPAPVLEPPPLPQGPPPPPPIGFHNGPAVRTALLTGVLSIVLLMITGQIVILQLLGPLWLIAGGFFAVVLYSRKTGQRLSPMSGAHLGWISGVFGFLLMTVILTLIAVALSEPSAVSALRTQWSGSGRSEADFDTMLDAFHSPEKIVAILSMVLVMFSILPAFGGALGAKFFDRPNLAGRE